jgi:hypothetical protein
MLSFASASDSSQLYYPTTINTNSICFTIFIPLTGVVLIRQHALLEALFDLHNLRASLDHSVDQIDLGSSQTVGVGDIPDTWNRVKFDTDRVCLIISFHSLFFFGNEI